MSAVNTLGRYFSAKLLTMILVVYGVCIMLVFFIDFVEMMREAAKVLQSYDIPFEKKVVSAHRTPDLLFTYAGSAASRGLAVLIAGAGGAAHLPGMAASKTPCIGPSSPIVP